MRPRPASCVAVLAMGALASIGHADAPGVLASIVREGDAVVRWNLPSKLHEISGLTATPDGRVLAHEDQNGIVYELDPERGTLVKAFALGSPTVRGDFEGIAIAGDRIYLVTSAGRLHVTHERGDGERSRYDTIDSRADEGCLEVEGLGYDAGEGVLLIACKRARRDDASDLALVYRWSPADRAPAAPAWIRVDRAALGGGDFRPSGVAFDERTGHLLVLSSQTHSIAEITRAGEVVETWVLSAGEHRQAEGIALWRGALLVADEGASGRARLTIHPPLPPRAPRVDARP